jgi:hypothetical protein
MLTQNETNLGPTGESKNRTPLVVGAAAALVLLSGVLYTRSSSTSTAETARPATVQRNADTVAFYGNGQLKVLSFYANPVEVKRGARALVCYGVSNAASVSIEPPVGETWPSTSRCLEVTAAKDTDYKLTAKDAAGHQETRTVSLHVAR